MKTVLVTGSCGLVGSTAARFYLARGFRVIGIDNDMRKTLFGASTGEIRKQLSEIPGYEHWDWDIRDPLLSVFFENIGSSLVAIIHTAAQPSHDWAAKDPHTDFGINAVGTLNLLEMTRKNAPKAVFVFCSTNKVYGDSPNRLPLWESETRYETFWEGHQHNSECDLEHGINEALSIDQCKHSLFGCSKLAADVLVQEYGRYFGMNTVCFRGGCLTGPAHAGAKLHGFLSYLVKCAMNGETYQIIGYNGKQVRDNIHAADLVEAFDEFIRRPKQGEVYNIGGGRERSCSVIEAIALVEKISGRKIKTEYVEQERSGDHIWWITDMRKFERDYPNWKQRYSLEQTISEIVEAAHGN